MNKINKLNRANKLLPKLFSLWCFFTSINCPLMAAKHKKQRGFPAGNIVVEAGIARLTDPANKRMLNMGVDLAKTNALLSLRRTLYKTVATEGELLGILLVKNSSISPLLDNILKNATFSDPATVIPDLIEIEATISTLDIQRIIAPVLLGKDPSKIEFTANNLLTGNEQSSATEENEELAISTPEGSSCARSFFPGISSHEPKLAADLRQKLANFVIDGGKIIYKKRASYKRTDSKAFFTADSIGGIGKAAI